MRARLINIKSFYLGLKECILPKLFLVYYSLLRLESFLGSSTNLISTYSFKTILVDDNKNLVETFRSNIYQNETIKIYIIKIRLIKNSLLLLQRYWELQRNREFKEKYLSPNS